MNYFSGTKAFLFDFDGTLVDTMGAFADLAGELMATYYGGKAEKGRANYLKTSGIPFFQQLAVLYPGDPRNEQVAVRFESEKLVAYNSKGLFVDVAPAVEAFHKRGIAAVVSSNNFTPVVKRFLETQQVPFDLVLGYDKGFCKGEPHFAEVEKVLGIPRQQLGFVGDSVRDGELAEAGGVKFAARLGTVPQERFEARFGSNAIPFVDSLLDVVGLLD